MRIYEASTQNFENNKAYLFSLDDNREDEITAENLKKIQDFLLEKIESDFGFEEGAEINAYSWDKDTVYLDYSDDNKSLQFRVERAEIKAL